MEFTYAIALLWSYESNTSQLFINISFLRDEGVHEALLNKNQNLRLLHQRRPERGSNKLR